MTIPPHILETAYGKEGAEREDYLIEVLETIFGTLEAITCGLPNECGCMTPQQRSILQMLILNAGKVISNQEISDHCAALTGKSTFPSKKTVQVQVHRIRCALPRSFGMIETVGRQGYRLNLAEGA